MLTIIEESDFTVRAVEELDIKYYPDCLQKESCVVHVGTDTTFCISSKVVVRFVNF